MHTPPGQDDVATVTPSEGTIEYRAIARRIVWLQTQLPKFRPKRRAFDLGG